MPPLKCNAGLTLLATLRRSPTILLWSTNAPAHLNQAPRTLQTVSKSSISRRSTVRQLSQQAGMQQHRAGQVWGPAPSVSARTGATMLNPSAPAWRPNSAALAQASSLGDAAGQAARQRSTGQASTSGRGSTAAPLIMDGRRAVIGAFPSVHIQATASWSGRSCMSSTRGWHTPPWPATCPSLAARPLHAVAEIDAVTTAQELRHQATPLAAADAMVPERFPEGPRRARSDDPAARATGMAVTWLGTSSGAPTLRRNVSSIALRLPQHTLLVDCGEATNRQLTRAGIEAARVRSIFITHMHGDHCFGLPGVLSLISGARAGTELAQVPLLVFGPPGIQQLVSAAFSFSHTKLSMPVTIAEFTTDPSKGFPPRPAPDLEGIQFACLAPDYTPAAAQALKQSTNRRVGRSDQISLHEVAVLDGLTWTIPCEGGVTVAAAQLQHRVPCWGYVIKEADRPPRERTSKLTQLGLAPGTALDLVKGGAGPKTPVKLGDGGEVALRELIDPPLPGRKVVLLGDTCDSTALAGLGAGADLLSHEATFSRGMAQKAQIAQHSTASMAGSFARRLKAATLVLTHFSSRYAFKPIPGASDEATAGDIRSLCKEAQAAFGNSRVFAAQDFYTYEVPFRHQLPVQQDFRPSPVPSQRRERGPEARRGTREPDFQRGLGGEEDFRRQGGRGARNGQDFQRDVGGEGNFRRQEARGAHNGAGPRQRRAYGHPPEEMGEEEKSLEDDDDDGDLDW